MILLNRVLEQITRLTASDWIQVGSGWRGNRLEPKPPSRCSVGMGSTFRPSVASLLLVVALLHGGGSYLYSQGTAAAFRADFSDGRLDDWKAVELARRANRFSIASERGDTALRVSSRNSASALWRGLELAPDESSVVAWRWKIDAALSGNGDERAKSGDDYAARFFVIFDSEPFSRDARAICYVWASSEPVGSTYRNPYFADVVTMVLQSGDRRAGEWVEERRDFIKDYLEAFGESPKSISAVAVMVDTDNTGSSATAWFDDILVER